MSELKDEDANQKQMSQPTDFLSKISKKRIQTSESKRTVQSGGIVIRKQQSAESRRPKFKDMGDHNDSPIHKVRPFKEENEVMFDNSFFADYGKDSDEESFDEERSTKESNKRADMHVDSRRNNRNALTIDSDFNDFKNKSADDIHISESDSPKVSTTNIKRNRVVTASFQQKDFVDPGVPSKDEEKNKRAQKALYAIFDDIKPQYFFNTKRIRAANGSVPDSSTQTPAFLSTPRQVNSKPQPIGAQTAKDKMLKFHLEDSLTKPGGDSKTKKKYVMISSTLGGNSRNVPFSYQTFAGELKPLIKKDKSNFK